MKQEVQHAVNFLTNIVTNGGVMNRQQLEEFRTGLDSILCTRYMDHWFPDKPNKGSAYRCIRINHKMDPLIAQVGSTCGVSEDALFAVFPNELTLWVDPADVSYRIGEEGSIGVLYNSQPVKKISPTPAIYSPPQNYMVQPRCSDEYRYVSNSSPNHPVDYSMMDQGYYIRDYVN